MLNNFSILVFLGHRLLVWNRHAQAHWENSFPWLFGMTVILCAPHPQCRPIPTTLLFESLTSVVYIFQPPLLSAPSSWVWPVPSTNRTPEGRSNELCSSIACRTILQYHSLPLPFGPGCSNSSPLLTALGYFPIPYKFPWSWSHLYFIKLSPFKPFIYHMLLTQTFFNWLTN